VSAGEIRVDFVCVRAAHHRRRPTSPCLCDHLGRPAYCPAGDVDDHDWMPLATELARLARIGYARIADVHDEKEAGEPDDDRILVLIR